MTNLAADPGASALAPPIVGKPDPTHRHRRLAVLIVVVVLIGAALLAVLAIADRNGTDGQTAHIDGQGGRPPVLADDGATLLRRDDGLFAVIDAPLPAPRTYEYPTGDMIPPWADPHPPVSPGASDAPEVFTAWLIVFNEPTACTDQLCDADDIGLDAAARGGVYQLDGRVAAGDRLTFAGGVRLGQEPLSGAPLDDPLAGDVHLAIAPHGRVLPGEDGWRQLNGPVGNPEFWWIGTFSMPQG